MASALRARRRGVGAGEQMIMHLPRPCRGATTRAPRGGASARAGLGIDESAPARAAPRTPAAATATDRRANGGSRKITSKRARLAREERARIGRRASRAPSAPNVSRGRRERAHERRIAVDRHRERRAARQRLERQRAAPGVEVEASPAGQVLAQPVEQRLAHAVGRRPQARRRAESGSTRPRKRPPMMRTRLAAAAARGDGSGRGAA